MYIVIGKFGAPYGVKGFIKLRSFSTPPNKILDYKDMIISQENSHKSVCVKGIKTTNNGTFIVSVDNIQDRDEVKMLTNKNLLVKRDSLPELNANEFYCCDIMGMSAISLNNRYIGNVTNIIETGSNDIFVISGQKKILVPYTESAVIDIDIKKRIITINPDFSIDN